MQWQAGLIFRVSNYRFEDDNSSRDKYGIVLFCNDTEAYIIHSLTTSQNNLDVPEKRFGCNVHGTIAYYFIPAQQVVGDDGYFFEKDTYIFFRNNVRKDAISKFSNAAKLPFGLISLGVLSNNELKRLLKCLLKSEHIPASLTAELTLFKESL